MSLSSTYRQQHIVHNHLQLTLSQGLQYRRDYKRVHSSFYMFIPFDRVSHSKGGSEGGKEEGGGGGGEGGCFDFSNHSIPCPSVPYFKRTLPHCEHILVCMCCIYIFSLLLLLLLFCHPFPSPPEASMAFSALFSLPTLFSPSF